MMEKTEIYQILNIIESAYPQMKICDDTLIFWMNQCRDMDYQLARKKLDAHILKSAYPPVIAEIAAYKNDENQILGQIKQWEQEGRERIERDKYDGKSKPIPSWLSGLSKAK